HRHLPPKRKVLPMSPVRNVTYLSGRAELPIHIGSLIGASRLAGDFCSLFLSREAFRPVSAIALRFADLFAIIEASPGACGSHVTYGGFLQRYRQEEQPASSAQA
ncbi:hypothetical protein, partial [Pseudorhizobium endolithicum]|uniref:hypothetical protein n=1 Tax=Pseudorhizobium endolithicum TaxID=1191678 RepID=UPI001B7D31A1